MSKKELQTHLEAIAASRRGKHPAPDDLLEYHLGECPPREAERIEDHLTFCADCSRHVLDMARFLKGEMAQHVEPVNDSRILSMVSSIGANRRDQDAPSTETLGFYRAAAAIFFLCSAALIGYVASRPDDAAGALRQAVANMPIIELSSSEMRSAEDVVDLKGDVAGAVLVIPLAATDSFPRYELAFSDQNKNILFLQSDLRRTAQGLLTIVVSRDFLPRGDYSVSIAGVTSGGEKHELTRFNVKWRPES